MSVTLHTDLGHLKIEVFCESVPKTAENFLALCASSAYDGSPIHRLIPGFMFQTGSPATSSTKTSTSIWHAPFEDEIRPTLRHNARGIVSMANKGPMTNGSQFFILFAPAPHLDGKNTVFGRLLGCEEVLDRIEAVAVDGKGRPKAGVGITGVTVHANPIAG
ncbi:Peptidyl-prolyl cis-trans isomerase cyp10 [Ptychographa xylographoides]|nr:Peptidyl-prolyl cis-trans isomerase cyp10 [Ptychographa xylographoides]